MKAYQHSIAVGVLISVLSYTLQRLIDAQNEPPMGSVLLQAEIPYYWRTTMAFAHGLAGGLLAYYLSSPNWLTWKYTHLITFGIFLVAVIAMLMVP